jgi:hypothetical protein
VKKPTPKKAVKKVAPKVKRVVVPEPVPAPVVIAEPVVDTPPAMETPATEPTSSSNGSENGTFNF